MNSSKQLFALQELDNVISEKQEALASIKAKLEDDHLLKQTRATLEKAEQIAREISSNQKEVDLQLSSVKEKADVLEKKLYSGSVTNPRELSDMQEELRILRSQQQKLEEQMLETMQALENAQSVLARSKQDVATIENQGAAEKTQLIEAQKRLQEELTLMENERKDHIVDIDRSALSLYESLRKTKKGVAVAKITGGLCQGCRIALPTKVTQQVRAGNKLVQCTSCGRILYVI